MTPSTSVSLRSVSPVYKLSTCRSSVINFDYMGLKCRARSNQVLLFMAIMLFCDVIWENRAYRGANNAYLYQPFQYISIHSFWIVQKVRKVISADAHIWQKVQALIRRHAERASSNQSLFFLFLNKPGFPRWCHILYLRTVLIKSCIQPSFEMETHWSLILRQISSD